MQYDLLRVLGAGGMGTVLLARERALERLVAIKVLHAEKARDSEAQERFRREARAAAKLTHPNIVPLHTFGEVQGDLYFVLGYVEGETLAERLERDGRLEPDEARRILAELADALGYAHRAGIIHRDLKPENILLDRASGRAMLTDFGIARELGREGSLTSTGMIVGTPSFMSPEQATGERELDGRSDLYALGVIAYRMVAGTLPFGGANVREVIVQHVAAAQPPLPEAVREGAPVLADAIMRALAKAKEDRWQGGAELAQVLRAGEGDELLPADLEEMEGSYGRGVLIVGATALAMPLLGIAGVLSAAPRETLMAAGLIFGTAAVVGGGGLLWERLKHPDRFPAKVRVGFRPPRWWSVWWPRRFRRPGDVWDRLPKEARFVRWLNFVSMTVFLPTQAALLVWVANPANSERLGRWMIEESPAWRWGITIVSAAAIAMIGAVATASFRLRKRLGMTLAQFRQMQPLANADPRWRAPRYQAVLEPAKSSPAERASTQSLIAELRRRGVPLPDGLTDALEGVARGARALEQEAQALRELVDAEDAQRLERRIAALGDGNTPLRGMLESQRALVARAESRLAELGELRQSLDAQQALLRQQLVAMRDLIPSGGDLTGIHARLGAITDDLRRLAEGLAEVRDRSG